MSAASTPIPAARFAAALESLSLSSLYTKVSELQNSIAHLEASNAELEEYARKEDDKDCYDALMENEEVIGRMMARIELVKREVIEVRGLPWMTEDGEGAKKREVGERRPDGGIEGPVAASNGDARARTNGTARPVGNGSDAEAGDDGVFL